MTFEKEKNRWEIPGGGEEARDNGNLLFTAIRETHEEAMLIVRPKGHTVPVGNLVQVIPGTGGKTGIAAVFQSQVFTPKTGCSWRGFQLFKGDQPAENTESAGVRLIRLKDIFCEGSAYEVPLGHRRMFLHMLNVEKNNYTPLEEGIRLGQPVTAEVPHLGIVTC